VLGNGLTILTLEDRTTPVVSFQIWVRVGSGDESRFTGLAHLFEHMMFRGSKNLPPEAHGRIIAERGGRVNAYTSPDVTVYFSDVTAEHLPLVIELEAERLKNLDISEESLKSEREVVLEERRLRTENSPDGRAFEALLALTFQAHPYRVPVIGWRSDVEKVGVEDCLDFFRTYYAPDNLVVSIAGDFEADLAIARIERQMGSLDPAGEIPRNPTIEPEQEGERRSTVYFEVRGLLLAMAWHALHRTCGRRSPRRGERDPLQRPDQSALSPTRLPAGEALLPPAPTGSCSAGVFRDRGSPAGRERGRGGGFRARSTGCGRIRSTRRSSRRRSGASRSPDRWPRYQPCAGCPIAQITPSLGRIRPLDERLGAIRAVSAEDVQRVARTYLVPEKRSVVHVVPRPAVSEEGSP
jgi:zinc protease